MEVCGYSFTTEPPGSRYCTTRRVDRLTKGGTAEAARTCVGSIGRRWRGGARSPVGIGGALDDGRRLSVVILLPPARRFEATHIPSLPRRRRRVVFVCTGLA
jgi:hypothetical protein